MDKSSPTRVERAARLRWVPIEKIEYSLVAQREKINLARVDEIAAHFDVEQLGNPTVNERDGHFYAIDGMHRVEACKLIGWGDQQLQCWTYTDLTDEQMAERFLKLNDTLSISAYDKFRVGVNAGRLVECDIDRIVRAQGLRVSRTQEDGSIQAVGTLRKVYERGGPRVLQQTLMMIRDTYGTPGLDAVVIDGLAMLVQRYGGALDFAHVQRKLSGAAGGVNGLLNKAEKLRLSTGHLKAQCVAAAAVEIANSGSGRKKLASWFREDAA